MGTTEEYGSGTRMFGSVDDWIIEHIGFSDESS